MTHWRQRHDPDLTRLKRRDARFDRTLTLAAIGLIGLVPLLWWVAMS